MIRWLDFWLFGNGHGLAAPHWNQRFYWMSGRFYTWMSGLGAQLHSFQWTHPLPGTRRRLCGREYVVFSSRRKGPRVIVAWGLAEIPRLSLNEANALLKQVEDELCRNS